MNNSPYLSIIIPVYNTERYISACLDSILEQDFTNYEILLIDDGSSDNSGKVCDDYSLSDDRIKVFHKVNGGVCSARNVGILNAHGEWLYFCDSDDEVLPGGLSLLVSYSHCDEVSMVMGGFQRCTENGKVTYSVNVDVSKCLDRDQTLLTLFRQTYYDYQGYLWTKIFKRSIVEDNHLFFNDNISFNEDRLFITQYICSSGKGCVYFTKPVYLYYKRDSSAMQSLENGFNRKFISDFDAFLLMDKTVKSVGASDKVIHAVELGLMLSYISITDKLRKFDKDEEICRYLYGEIKQRGFVMKTFYWRFRLILSKIKDSLA